MMHIRLIDEDHVVTFDLKIGDSVFVLRQMDTATLDDFRRKANVKKWRKHQPEEEFDNLRFASDTLDWGLMEWRGVKHPNKNEDVPCVRENKVRLPIFVQEQIRDAILDGQGLDDEDDAEKKTSSTTSPEGGTSQGPTAERVKG